MSIDAYRNTQVSPNRKIASPMTEIGIEANTAYQTQPKSYNDNQNRSRRIAIHPKKGQTGQYNCYIGSYLIPYLLKYDILNISIQHYMLNI